MKPILTRQLGALVSLTMLNLYRRKDLIAVGVLGLVLLFPLAAMKPFGVAGADRYMCEISLLLIWVFSFLLTLGLAARELPPEFEARTIFPLLAKPVGRGTVILGKYLGALAAALSALAAFYLLYGVFVGFKEGNWFPVIFWQAFLLHAGCLALVAAFALTLSLVLTPSANLTLSGLAMFGMLFFGMRLPDLAAGSPQPEAAVLRVIDAVAPHAEFFDMRQRLIHGWEPVSWGVCALVLLYALLYSGALLLVASAVFRRKQV